MNVCNYASDVIDVDALKRNNAIIGRRNVGKTTFLFEYFLNCLDKFDGKIFIIDSATAHPDKSLLIKIKNIYDCLYIESPQNIEDNLDLADVNTLYPIELLRKNNKKIVLIDSSRFLEESYTVDNVVEREQIRNKYKLFVEYCLYQINVLNDEFILIMDEIELTSQAANILSDIKDNCISINAVHDISYVNGICDLNLINVDRLLLKRNRILNKQVEQLCGNACAEVVATIFYNKNGHTSKELFWCTDIGLFLLECYINVDVYCWKSNFYEDYQKDYNTKPECFNTIRNYENSGGIILNKPLTKDVMVNELLNNKCGIYCVKSSIFHNNATLEGGHYVVAFICEKKICCLNPEHTIINLLDNDMHRVIDACTAYGSWRILCH